MAKTALEQWDETNANNSDIGGTNIAEGCAPSGINNAIREEMAQIAAWLGDDTLASAATTDLGSVPGRYVAVTGTTTITSFGTIKAGTVKYVKFSGALTLTHNSTSLILPGAANIITAAGDIAILASEGSGNWRCLAYMRAGGGPQTYVLRALVGTSTSTIEFNDIPPAVSRISVILNGFSTNGTASVLAQLGTSGGWITSGYAGSRIAATSSAALAAAVDSSGVFIAGGNADATYSGVIHFIRAGTGSTLWAFHGATARSDLASYSSPAGIVSAGAEVTRIRINAGSDTRDAGSVAISYEM